MSREMYGGKVPRILHLQITCMFHRSSLLYSREESFRNLFSSVTYNLKLCAVLTQRFSNFWCLRHIGVCPYVYSFVAH